MVWLKVLIVFVFAIIFWQDYKDRMVHWFLYPIVGVLGFLIQLFYTDIFLLILNSVINLCFILTVLAILWVYAKLVLKQNLVNKGIGIGDVLFFVFLPFCFSIISFFILFVFSLLFSLLIFLILKVKNPKMETIPLAGFMSLFFGAVYISTFFVNCNFIFAY